MENCSNPPQKPQNHDNGNNDPRQRSAHGDHPDCLFLKGVESVTKCRELRFHAVAPVLAPDDDFEGEEAAVESGKAVAYRFAAEFATFGKIVEQFFVGHFLEARIVFLAGERCQLVEVAGRARGVDFDLASDGSEEEVAVLRRGGMPTKSNRRRLLAGARLHADERVRYA